MLANLKAILGSIVFVVTAFVLVGCSDNPQDQAAKAANEAVAEAIKSVEVYKVDDQIDYEAAHKKIKSAFSLVSKAGQNMDRVYLIAGDLSAAQAQKLSERLPLLEIPIIDQVKSTGTEILNYIGLENEYMVSKMLHEASISEAQTLDAVVSGNSGIKGIQEKLSNVAGQIEQLRQEHSLYKKHSQAAQAMADNLQAQADQLLRQAELSQADERLSLEKQAYEIIKGSPEKPGKIHFSAEVQKNLDLLDVTQGKIDILVPLALKLEKDEIELLSRISELVSQDNKTDYLKHLAVLQSQMEEKKELLDSHLDILAISLETYEDKFVASLEAYANSQSDYGKSRNRELRNQAKVEAADAGADIAKLYFDHTIFYARLSNYFQSYVSMDADVALDRIEALAQKASDSLEDAYSKLAVSYDETLSTLEEVMEASRDTDLSVRAVRKYLIVVSQRLVLAQEAMDQTLYDSLLAKVEEYKKIAIEADPYFSKALPAKLLSPYGVEFKTEEEKLQEQYIALRTLFEEAADQAEEKRKQTLTTLIQELYELDRPRDAKIFDELVKNILEAYKADWIAIKSANQEMEALEVFGDQLEVDGQDEDGGEFYEEDGEDYDTSSDMFGEPNEN